MEWFAATLQFADLKAEAQETEATPCIGSLVVFSAESMAEAFSRAMEMGRSREIIYRNREGGYERHAFVKLEAIEALGPEIDGREIQVKSFQAAEHLPFDAVFNPADQADGPVSQRLDP